MSGKAYTMREMKAIIEYLTEHKAYGEIKGRKMWMDYANSKLTTRTWQSLKETFLKRILPDISNPYYKLTLEQISSFQQGTDLEAKVNNKLEIQTIDDESSNDTHKKDSQPSNSNNARGGNNAGEDIQCSEINQHRSSTETVVIGPCYNNAEDIQKDLVSPSKENFNDDPLPVPSSTKSMRDYITYSEPLTPMLQEVLHDFASEDEGDEPQMQIVEYPEPSRRNETTSPLETLNIENTVSENENNEDADNNIDRDNSNNEDSTGNNIDEDILLESDINDAVHKSDNVQCIDDSEENSTNIDNVVPDVTDIDTNSVSKNNDVERTPVTNSQKDESITDTLPNNQEALKEINKNSLDKHDSDSVNSIERKNDSRKRSKSKEIDSVVPEKKNCTDKSREQNSCDRDVTALQQQFTSHLDSKENRTEIKIQSHSGRGKKANYNSEKLTAPCNSMSKQHKNCQNATKVGENMRVSDDSLSKRQASPIDVSINTDNDEGSLKSVQKYSSRIKQDTTSSSIKKSTKHNEKPGNVKEVMNDVVILKSHSESSSDHVMVSPKKNKASLRAAHNMHRDRALANVFGFSSGTQSNRKKLRKNVKRIQSHQRNVNSSSSEEWTSDTGTEFVSPPRGRKNKHSRKYLKPKPARVMSLEEEGGLFVMHGRKIYPVVKDGKLVKNFVSFTPDNDSEDEESYWKLKYVEEKKKTDELTKLLKHNETKMSAPIAINEATVPLENECQKSTPVKELPKEIVERSVEQIVKEPEKKAQVTESKTVKVQFMKDNETVQVEGHWSQIQPVLEQVVQILHKESEPREKPTKPISEKISVEREVPPQIPRSENPTPVKKQKVSRDSTPLSTIQLDDDVNEKLDKIEEEIYQKIQERDLAENQKEDAAYSNITKRKAGKPRIASLTAKKDEGAPEPAKRKSSLRPTDGESTDTSIVTRRQTRTPKKASDKDPVVIKEGKRSTRLSSKNAALESDDSSVKYKFRSPPRPEQTTNNKNKTTRKASTKQTTKNKYSIETARIFSSPENISINSIESSQGYQDTDGSNLSICLRKKRRLSLTVLNRGRANIQRVTKRKSQPYIHEHVSSDSDVSFVTAPLKSSSHRSSSLNTEVYRSESYQMLFPQRQNCIRYLEKIEERSPAIDDITSLNKNTVAASEVIAKTNSCFDKESNNLSPGFVDYEENSSNVTLPPSPVLSIVEKLSLNKSALDSTKDIDIPDDSRDEAKQTMLNDYMISDVNMCVPLMEQEYDVQKSANGQIESHFHLNVTEASGPLSDSLLNKVCAVNIAEPTLSESIHQKLKNLLLESAKKIADQLNKHYDTDKLNKMEISEVVDKQRKTKAKKRCSTPRKRQNTRQSKVSNVEPHIVDEHIESCEYEKSRPLPMLIITDAVEQNYNVVTTDVVGQKPERLKKKKDVIKVKILKPRMKKKDYSSDDIIKKQTKTSRQSDSGINDTESGVFLRGLEDSIDLIHNHSDTCLQAHECVGDSVEIIDDNAMSVISLNSNSVPIKKMKCASITSTSGHNILDICCENAQDAENLYTATEMSQHTSNENSYIFKSPIANISSVNSILTDDLSDEISLQHNRHQNRISKWYLLSEDEASNTNNIDILANMSNGNAGCGANLQEIFPITCAVPDLSTITEENTAKFVVDRNTISQFDIQSWPNV